MSELELAPFTYGFVADYAASIDVCRRNCADPRSFGAMEGNPGAQGGFGARIVLIQEVIDSSVCVQISGGQYATGDFGLRSNSVFIIDATRGCFLLTHSYFSFAY